jgi:TetR/AcrR family transcriptional regulator
MASARERRTTKKQKARKPGRPARPLTRGELVALAMPLFAQRGPDGVSMAEVAELAGIRKASMYHHFESKAALYAAVMDESLGQLRSLIAAARLDEGSFAERLDRLGALVTDALAARPEMAQLLVRELLGAGPYLAAGGAERVRETLEVTAAFLEAGMDAGEFARSDPRQLAISVSAVHLLAFAAQPTVTALLGQPIVSGPGLEARRAAVLEHVRRLCLAPAPATRRPIATLVPGPASSRHFRPGANVPRATR